MSSFVLKQNTLPQEHAVRVLGTFMGLDLSLTKTAIASLTPTMLTSTVLDTPADKIKGLSRLAVIVGAVLAQVDRYKPSLVAIEGYSYGSAQSQPHSLGELGGLVKMELAKRGVPMMIVPPNNLKKIMSGKGSGGKGPVMLGLLKRFGVEVPEDNQADASALSFTAALASGALPETTLPKPHLEGLKGCERIVSPFPRTNVREKSLQPVAPG